MEQFDDLTFIFDTFDICADNQRWPELVNAIDQIRGCADFDVRVGLLFYQLDELIIPYVTSFGYQNDRAGLAAFQWKFLCVKASIDNVMFKFTLC